jgi:hypothetical protein
MMARMNGRATATVDETVQITWAPKDIHFFDEKGIRQSGMTAASPVVG